MRFAPCSQATADKSTKAERIFYGRLRKSCTKMGKVDHVYSKFNFFSILLTREEASFKNTIKRIYS